jgi:hypothetical protein
LKSPTEGYVIRRSRDDRRAAYHEAGHAVARVVLGLGATRVEVERDGSGTTHGTHAIYRDHGALIARIQMALAGPVAEARYAHRALSEILAGPGSGDLASAEDMLDALGLNAQHLEPFFRMTRTLVLRWWDSISAVAQTLVTRRSLKADELLVAMGRSSVALAEASRPDRLGSLDEVP